MPHGGLSLKVLAPNGKETAVGTAHNMQQRAVAESTRRLFLGHAMVHCRPAEFKNRCSASSTLRALL